MNSVVYLRTSTEEQSPENQKKDVMTIAPPESEVLYEQQSAWKDNLNNRPVFASIVEGIKKGKIEAVYVWDLDRLYRNMKRQVEFFELCKAFKVKVSSYRQQFLSDLDNVPAPWNEIVFDIIIKVLGYYAEEESRKKSERVKLAVRKRKGKTVSYKGNKWGRKSIPNQTCTRVLELRKQGKSIREIAEEVTYWDSNRNPKKLSKSAVHKIIRGNTT